jgi:hypothetical protein
VRWVRFMVAVSSPHMGLDTLPTSVAQPFAVTGWGLDSGVPSGTGADHVQVWAYPNPGSGAYPVYWGTSPRSGTAVRMWRPCTAASSPTAAISSPCPGNHRWAGEDRRASRHTDTRHSSGRDPVCEA